MLTNRSQLLTLLSGNNDFLVHIVAIEASQIVLDNKQLMNNWKKSYLKSNYFGSYASNVWKNNL
jgi:hypothetical protein